MSKPETIVIDDVKYVRADSVQAKVVNKDMVIVRCARAGVFFGHLVEVCLADGTAVLKNARRIWYWSGAASLSQLAIDGTTKPKECKFPEALSMISVTEVLEVIPCTEKSINSINSVPTWKQ